MKQRVNCAGGPRTRPSPFAHGVYQVHVLRMGVCRAMKYLRGVLGVIISKHVALMVSIIH